MLRFFGTIVISWFIGFANIQEEPPDWLVYCWEWAEPIKAAPLRAHIHTLFNHCLLGPAEPILFGRGGCIGRFSMNGDEYIDMKDVNAYLIALSALP